MIRFAGSCEWEAHVLESQTAYWHPLFWGLEFLTEFKMLALQFCLEFLKIQPANFLRPLYKSHHGWLMSVSRKPVLRICVYQHAWIFLALSMCNHRERIMLYYGLEGYWEDSGVNLALHRVHGLKNACAQPSPCLLPQTHPFRHRLTTLFSMLLVK